MTIDELLPEWGWRSAHATRVAAPPERVRPWQLHGGHLPIASAEDFRAFNRPGWVRVATALVVEPDGAGARVRTETRIAATDAGAGRRFGRYWRVIAPFSAITRRELLATVRRRAEVAR